MPETTNTKQIAKRNSFFSKAFFKEYEVEAGKPITVLANYQDVTGWQCSSAIAYSFVPEAGKDYEGSLDVDRQCRLVIKEIRQVNDQTTLEPVETKDAPKCS
jgi:hypothetical protein